MDEDLAENWRRALANLVAIRGLLFWLLVVGIAILLAVAASAYAIVNTLNSNAGTL